MSRSQWPDPAPRFAVLRHPLFLGALALLLVNDHVLKGAGILPGVVTGKLSDLAGLLVAPLFVAALAGARTPRARALAFASVALPFTAIKLSAAAAFAAVALAGLLGVHARIWQDPTDLLALVMLLPAWRLADRAQAVSPASSRSLPAWALERAVAGVSAVACVATSSVTGPGTYSTDAYIVNVAPDRVDVRVRWVDADLDCGALLAGDPTRILGANAFNLGITYRLEPHETLPLERAAAFAAAGQDGAGGGPDDGGPTSDRACEVVLVEADRMPAMMLWWGDLPYVGVTASTDEMKDFWSDESLVAGRVTLMPPGVGTSDRIGKGPLRLTVSPSACVDAPQSSIQWTSPSPQLPSVGILEELQEVPGGCLELTMRYPQLDGSGGSDPGTGGAGGMDPGTGGAGGMDPGTGGAGGNGTGGNGTGGIGAGGAGMGGSGPGEEPSLLDRQVLYLCVPLEDFPFVNGDEIQIVEQVRNLSIRDFISTRRLEVYRDRDVVSLGGLVARAVSAGKCEGDRLPCGAYVQPAALSVQQASGGTELLSPGGKLAGPGYHLWLGRSERVVAAREACGPGLDEVGITADFLISWQ